MSVGMTAYIATPQYRDHAATHTYMITTGAWCALGFPLGTNAAISILGAHISLQQPMPQNNQRMVVSKDTRVKNPCHKTIKEW